MSAKVRDHLYRQRERLIAAAAKAADRDDELRWKEAFKEVLEIDERLGYFPFARNVRVVR